MWSITRARWWCWYLLRFALAQDTMSLLSLYHNTIADSLWKKQLCAGIHCWPPMSSAINQSQHVILSSLRLISVPFWHFQNQVLITCTFVPFLTLSIACVIFYMIIFRQMSAAMGMAQGNEMVQCRQPQRSEASSMRLMLLCSLTKHYIEALH